MRSIPPLIAAEGGLPRLIALYAATWQFGTIVGPASSGLLYEIDPAAPYLAAAIGAALGAIATLAIRYRRPQERTPSRADADVAPCPRGSALRAPSADPARGDLPRPVRRVVRRCRCPAAGDRRGPPARRQHRLRLAARRAGRGSGHRVGVAGGSPDSSPGRRGVVHCRRRVRRDDGGARCHRLLRRRLRRARGARRRRFGQCVRPGDARAAGDARSDAGHECPPSRTCSSARPTSSVPSRAASPRR